MFSKKERLTRAAFTQYFKTGKRLHSDVATLIYQPYPTTHAAVVVGKKVLKKAHERNKIRRRIYGVLYRMLKKSNQTGIYIFLTKPTFTSLTKKQQQEAVQNLLMRITLSK